MYSFRGSASWLSSTRGEDHDTTVVGTHHSAQEESVAEMSGALPNKWKPRRLFLQVDNSDDEDNNSVNGEGFFPDSSASSIGRQEEDDVLHPEMIEGASLFCSPLKFKARQTDGDDEDKSADEDSTIFMLEQCIHQAPPEAIQQDEQRKSEKSSQPSPWGNKCKAKQNIWKELDDLCKRYLDVLLSNL